MGIRWACRCTNQIILAIRLPKAAPGPHGLTRETGFGSPTEKVFGNSKNKNRSSPVTKGKAEEERAALRV
jgi:hypothetical protein